jgi:hypothetical protein
MQSYHHIAMDESTKFISHVCHESWPFVQEKPHFLGIYKPFLAYQTFRNLGVK